ncbi:MAG TPA: TetR/AcrR family transcriptional regulator [Nitriliruptorales bacterium]|nr:TetR/AcrR family transcriptional regulator [Nitriliruptorales bacterium]
MARYRSGLETRQRILEATRALLGEVGLEGTTLKAICDRAGVGAGSFYNLFASKEEAVLTVVRAAIEAVDVGHDSDARRRETVESLVDAYLGFVTSEPTLARIYLQAAVAWGLSDPGLAARFARHQAQRVERVTAALLRERPELSSEDARVRAELLLSALNGLTVNWMLDPRVDLPTHRRRLLALVGVGGAVPSG